MELVDDFLANLRGLKPMHKAQLENNALKYME